MKWIYTFLAVATGAVLANAQTWQWQHPSPQGNNINDVAFSDSKTGYIVGDYGTILKTTNGGANWKILKSNITSALLSVTIASSDPKYIAVCGAQNTYGISTDAGVTWTPGSVSGGPPALTAWRSICFRDNTSSSTLLMCGDQGWIVQSTDGGQTFAVAHNPSNPWGTQGSGNPPITSGNLNEIHFFPNTRIGIAVGDDSLIVRTSDGGTAWNLMPPPHPKANLKSLALVSIGAIQDAFAVGTSTLNGLGFVWESSDQGVTWAQLPQGPTVPFTRIRSVPMSTQSLFATAADGSLIMTTNGGASWSTEPDFSALSVTTVLSSLALANNGFICVTAFNGRIFTRVDAAPNYHQWIERDYGTFSTLRDVSVADVRHVVACGDVGALITTTNSGAIWVDRVVGGGTNNMLGVSFTDSLRGYACDDGGRMFRTQDGGVNWSQQSVPTPAPLTCVRAVSDDIAFASSGKGEILKTTNAGGSWLSTQLPLYQGVSRVFFLSPAVGWAIAAKDSIFATADSGATWTPSRITTQTVSANLYDVCFTDVVHGYVLGFSAGAPAVFVTTNGGAKWVKTGAFVPPLAAASLNSVHMIDAVNGWCVGLRGLIYVTSDAGQNWALQLSGTNLQLLGVKMWDNENGWAVGYNGAIIKYSDTHPSIITPRFIDFGDVAWGGNKDTTVQVRKSTPATVTLTGSTVVEVDGSNSGTQFSLSTPVPSAFPPLDSITIRFSPQKAITGPTHFREAVMNVVGNNGGTVPAITLAGNGRLAKIEFANGADHNTGDGYVHQCVTILYLIKNAGEMAVDVMPSFTELGATHKGVFKYTGPPHYMLPGEIDTFPVIYCPDTTGVDSANISFSGGPTPIVGKITGKGVEIKLKITPGSTDCIDLGRIADTKTTVITIQNIGNIDDIVNMDVIPQDTQFSIRAILGYIPGSGNQLRRGPALNMTLQVTNRQVRGKRCDTTWVIFTNKFDEHLDSICLKWCYTCQTLEDHDVHFKCIPVNTCDSAYDVIRNSCDDSVKLDNIDIKGSHASAFHWKSISPPGLEKQLPGTPYYIPPNDSITLWWYFCPSPTDVGDMSDAHLYTYYPTPDEISVATGACGLLRGINYLGPVQPDCIDYGNVMRALTPISKTVQFKNLGTAEITVAVTRQTNDPAFQIQPGGASFTVAPFDSQIVTITYAPTADGCDSDVITWTAPLTSSVFHTCLHGCTFTPGVSWTRPDTCYGSMLVGMTACDTASIINSGTTVATISTVAWTDAANQFAHPPVLLRNGAPATLPVTLGIGESMQVGFCYVPTRAGHFSDTVTFTTSVAGATPRFVRCGDAYVTGAAQIGIYARPTQIHLADLGNPSVHAVIRLNNRVDSAGAFRCRVLFDSSRLQFHHVATDTLTAGWNLTTNNGPGWVTITACGQQFLPGAGPVADVVFTPYYGSAASTNICLDVPYRFVFNVCGSGDTTNPMATITTPCAVPQFDSVCGIQVGNIVFHTGTFLYQTMPNPATNAVSVPFQTKEAGHARVRVINAFGVEVAHLLDAEVPAGYRELSFTTVGLPEGVYFYELVTPDTRLVRRMMIVK